MAASFDPSISYILDGNLAKYRQLFISGGGPPVRYPRRMVLSCGGTDIPHMFFLLEGIIKVYTTNPGGYVRILGYHKRDTLFAMDGICGGYPAMVTTETVTPVRVLSVTWEDISRMGESDPSLIPELLRYYGTVLRLMCFDAESKSISDASARLAAFLCLYDSCHRKSGDESIRLTQEELASAVNASRVQISRICSDFRSRGLIDCSRGCIKILDKKGLMDISQYA